MRECSSRSGVHQTLAEIGISYISTLLELDHFEDATCMLHNICRTARHVSGLRDQGGLVERLNQLLIRAMSLYMLETKDMNPDTIVQAGNNGRLWRHCDKIYRCIQL